MAGEEPKPEKSTQESAEELSRLLELELMQKRAAWQQTNARYKTLKSLSILFLFMVIMAALVGFYLIYQRASEQRANRHPATMEGSPNP